MPTPRTYVSRTGKVYTDDDLDALADELASRELSPSEFQVRRRGRPRLGSAPSRSVPVRLDPELYDALAERAAADETTASDVMRTALRAYLTG